MSRALARLGAAFLAPSRDEVCRGGDGVAAGAELGWDGADDALPVAPAVAVLSRPGDAWVAGGAVALALAGASGAPVVTVWPSGLPAVHAPASPRARRLAARLAGRGHAARATGRVVLVALAGADAAGASPAVAVAEADRVAAAAGDAPVLRVFAGLRDDAIDDALLRSDRVVVAAGEDDDGVAALAAGALPGARVACVAAPGAARGLAAAGVALVAPLRAEAEAAVAGLR